MIDVTDTKVLGDDVIIYGDKEENAVTFEEASLKVQIKTNYYAESPEELPDYI